MNILVGARKSPLSQAQVQEVFEELQKYHPSVVFEPILMHTQGDVDLKTSLRELDKTNFFTKEVDEALLKGHVRVAIHSAKDLPDPLPEGLSLIALTKGKDPSDALIIPKGKNLKNLKVHAQIATSSKRREENVKKLRQDFTFCDIRGTIQSRIKAVEEGRVEGVVVAEAALIRLKLTHLNRVKVPGETTPLQGQLAIVARSSDQELALLFSCLDARKARKSLYLGIDLPHFAFQDRQLIHKPIIEIISLVDKQMFKELNSYTHFIFTSKNAVRLLFATIDLKNLQDKKFIAVGRATRAAIEDYGLKVTATADKECAEGIVEVLKKMQDPTFSFFWPHSTLSRTIVPNFFKENGLNFKEYVIYDTIPIPTFQLPDPLLFDEIIFTSPSVVDAFVKHVGFFPKDKVLTTIGSVTETYLAKILKNFSQCI